MKTLSEFLSASLQETTIPDHLMHRADDLTYNHLGKVDEETRESMVKAMTHGQHTHFPLSSSGSDADPDVVEHLTQHGYRIKDYKAGIATRKKVVGDGINYPKTEKWVDEKIGGILQKTNAPAHIKKYFDNDPARDASKVDKESLHVVISHHPLAVAGVSTGTGWSSCMNLDRKNGNVDNTRYIRDDSEHGTHAAYLVKGTDTDGIKHGHPSAPIARISLKPFHHTDDETGEKHTIFRPEHNQYGSGGIAFHNAVSNWAHVAYPAKPDSEYYKNDNVYNDDDKTYYEEHAPESIKTLLDRRRLPNELDAKDVNILIDHAFDRHKKHTENDRAAGLEHDFASPILKQDLEHIANTRNLTTPGVHALYHINKSRGFTQQGNDNNWSLAVRHGDKFSTSMIQDHVTRHGQLTGSMLQSKKLTPEIIDKHVDVEKIGQLHHSLITPHLVDKAVSHYLNQGSGSRYLINDLKSKLDANHINRLVEYGRQHLATGNPDKLHGLIFTSPHFTKEQHSKLVDAAVVGKSRIGLYDISSNNRKFEGIESQLNASKHADLESGARLTSPPAFRELMDNVHVDPIGAKNLMMKKITELKPRPEYRYMNDTGLLHIPSRIGDHMTHDDYKTLVDHNVRANFWDSTHNNKFLDAHQNAADKMDREINDHLESKMDADEDYDQDDDQEYKDKMDKLHSHMEKYAYNISDHIDHHVESDTRGVLKDWSEKEKTHERLTAIGSMDNYKTPTNSNRYDEHEHWDDHFADEEDRLHNMEEPNDDHWDH